MGEINFELILFQNRLNLKSQELKIKTHSINWITIR